MEPSSARPGILTIQHLGEAGQEAEAKKGEVKLLLMCLGGDANIYTAKLMNIMLTEACITP